MLKQIKVGFSVEKGSKSPHTEITMTTRNLASAKIQQSLLLVWVMQD